MLAKFDEVFEDIQVIVLSIAKDEHVRALHLLGSANDPSQ